MLCYSASLLVNMFIFMDINIRSNMKKAIQLGSTVNGIFFEIFFKPNFLDENSTLIGEDIRLILEKHTKVIRNLRLSNESFYFYCKNDNEQFYKLIENYLSSVKTLFK